MINLGGYGCSHSAHASNLKLCIVMHTLCYEFDTIDGPDDERDAFRQWVIMLCKRSGFRYTQEAMARSCVANKGRKHLHFFFSLLLFSIPSSFSYFFICHHLPSLLSLKRSNKCIHIPNIKNIH